MSGPRALALASLLLASGLAAGHGPAADPAPRVVRPAGPGTVSERASRRAFYTAPPVVPHDVERYERTSGACLRCHLQERPLGGQRSMLTPHAQLSNCLQCHVAASPPRATPTEVAPGNAFRGLEEPREGSRAHAFAPPTIPHRLALRRDCANCHSASHPNPALRVSHAWRRNCLQCHVPGGPEFRTLQAKGDSASSGEAATRHAR